MTQISIVTGGSRGDVQPYIALGKGLKNAGYEVQVIASQDFENLITQAGLMFASTGFSVESVLQSDEWREITERGNFLAIMSKMQKAMKQQAHHFATILPDLLQGTDWMMTGVGGFGGGFSIAQKLNIPLIQAYVFPITPTHEYASPIAPIPSLGKFLNPLSFHALRQMLWQSTRSADIETRRLLNMEKASFWGPFHKLDQQQIPTLYGYSRYVVPIPADWGANHHVTGYWYLDEPSDWEPPADFVTFMNAGDKPVYIGFGSMLNKNPQQVADTVLEALAISGQRGVLSSGWGGIQQHDLPDNVYMIGSMPHSWLFPQMKAVVHHGGAGTTAAGLRAGIPSIVVPFMGDQTFWGRRIQSLGVGTAPIPRKQLSADRLASAIKQVVTDNTLQQNARELGQRLQHEDGVENAVRVVKATLAQSAYPVHSG